MYVYYASVGAHKGQIGCTGTRIIDSYELPHRFWETNPGPL